MVTFLSLTGMDQPGNVPSSRYWLLWPGVMIMICYSFAEMLIHWKVIWMGMLYVWANLKTACRELQVSLEKSSGPRHGQITISSVPIVEGEQGYSDPEEQTSAWIWGTRCLLILTISCVIFELKFDISWGLAIFSSILGISFSCLCIHSNGVNDINPTTAAAKASQLVFGGVTSAQGLPPEKALSTHIIAGAMAAGAAAMSNTIISNYRTGFLLKTPPRPEFWAQATGAIVSVFLAPGIFMLFIQAYPCVVADRCAFPAPSVAAWVAVAQAVTMRNVPIPRSSAIFACVTGFVAVVQVILKNRFG